jgi:hypothetical protein
MPADAPRRLADLLAAGRLADLAREAGRRRDLTERVRALLPAEEAAHLINAGRNAAGELVLTMDSGAWAARARYLDLGGGTVRVKVQPGDEVTPRARESVDKK